MVRGVLRPLAAFVIVCRLKAGGTILYAVAGTDVRDRMARLFVNAGYALAAPVFDETGSGTRARGESSPSEGASTQSR